MSHPLVAASGLFLLLAAPAPFAGQPVEGDMDGQVQQRAATLHVPRVTVTTTTIIMRSAQPIALVEKKTDDCVKIGRLAGFSVNRFDSVDLLLKDGKLVRAKLGNDCPALGFYDGFYLKATKDKKLCAKRDALRSRSGRLCNVQQFAALVPAR